MHLKYYVRRLKYVVLMTIKFAKAANSAEAFKTIAKKAEEKVKVYKRYYKKIAIFKPFCHPVRVAVLAVSPL